MDFFVGIHPDFSTSKFSSKKHAAEAGCIYLLENTQSSDGGGYILDLDGNRLPFIKIGNWKAHDPHKNQRYSIKYKSQLQIEDPKGEVRSYDFDNPLTLKKIIKSLRELSVFSSWKEHELQTRINELEKENKKLKEQIQSQESVSPSNQSLR